MLKNTKPKTIKDQTSQNASHLQWLTKYELNPHALFFPSIMFIQTVQRKGYTEGDSSNEIQFSASKGLSYQKLTHLFPPLLIYHQIYFCVVNTKPSPTSKSPKKSDISICKKCATTTRQFKLYGLSFPQYFRSCSSALPSVSWTI